MSRARAATGRLILTLTAAAAAAAVLLPTASAAEPERRMIVGFKQNSSGPGRAAVASHRGRVAHEVYGGNAVAVHITPADAAALARNPHVEYVEEDALRFPLAVATPSTGTPYAVGQLVPYGIQMVQADQLSTANASTRKICIIDSGYDGTHPDLPHDLDVTGDNDPGTGNWFTDENSHGTHVAGTIAALNNASGVVGVNSNGTIKLHIIKVFGAAGWAYSSTLSTAANKCRDAGANIISMSLGGPTSNRTEQRTFDALYAAGILPIAAAGNDGNTRTSYPAGYTSVVSVAAVDENKVGAAFSQSNRDVEISGPGVAVLSTVPVGHGSASELTVGTTVYAPGGMEGSPKTTASGALADFGLGGTAVAGSMTGKVCLIQRGTFDFATKVANCQASGGVGAVVYNNVAGSFGGTLGTTVTAIPSVTASDTEGTALRAQLGQTATVRVTASDYAVFDGTSMATPHVSAVAALVWALNPGCTAAQLRTSLNNSAEDLGAAGRDNKYGFGLVRAKAAVDRIAALGCGR